MFATESVDFDCPNVRCAKALRALPMWEGDHIFLDLMEEKRPFFSLKLVYDDGRLTEAVLDGRKLR